ncbi:glycosyltransferase family 39 protein [Candidatus Woesebacteria bacterium]|nr:glycosyltransferase family 39 protein [Candidatus Woesebacteria bacterium]MBP9687167.1 glycosyltransferase family 39 protein [Candidatus Woesebacteria bacterium]
MPKIQKNKLSFVGVLLIAILVFAFFMRVYRIDYALGFYFDQGRDALAIWDLIRNHKFFLIGPTTGIAGIFRGPFYYYLIAPFYLIGQGNPLYPSIFLSLTSVGALALLFKLTRKIIGAPGALMATLIGAGSFYIILASRWLSNPTPMLLLSMALIYAMFLILEGKKWAWVAIGFISGTSLFHFGSSGEFFYFPALAIFFLWQTKPWSSKRNLPSFTICVLTVLAFLSTAAPLVLFDLRHDHILWNNVKAFLFEKGSFKGNFMDVLRVRFDFYYSVFASKLFETRNNREIILMIIPIIGIATQAKKLFTNKYFLSVFLLFMSPIIGLLFFQGNEGNIYDYYLTGYYLVFILLFSVGLGVVYKSTFGKIFLVVFFYVFLQSNLAITFSRLNDNGDGENTIIFANQKQALNWIYEDASGAEFNTDVYVPPVIPYAYDYLFTWYSQSRNGWVHNGELSRLYTLYEEDPPHPERLLAWKKRQEGIGKILYEKKFGGITVQRRERIPQKTNEK